MIDPLLTPAHARDLDPVDPLDPLGFKLDNIVDTLQSKRIKSIKGIKKIRATHAHTRGNPPRGKVNDEITRLKSKDVSQGVRG